VHIPVDAEKRGHHATQGVGISQAGDVPFEDDLVAQAVGLALVACGLTDVLTGA